MDKHVKFCLSQPRLYGDLHYGMGYDKIKITLKFHLMLSSTLFQRLSQVCTANEVKSHIISHNLSENCS
jgi:hypothetical protein